jgi:hypothetical protein
MTETLRWAVWVGRELRNVFEQLAVAWLPPAKNLEHGHMAKCAAGKRQDVDCSTTLSQPSR